MSFSVNIVSRMGQRGGSLKLTSRATVMTIQNTGNAKSLAMTPDVPNTSAAPIVTKIARDVRGKQALQGQVPRGIYVAAIEAQQRGDARLHWLTTRI
jgi:hypothetical protein